MMIYYICSITVVLQSMFSGGHPIESDRRAPYGQDSPDYTTRVYTTYCCIYMYIYIYVHIDSTTLYTYTTILYTILYTST